MTFEQELTNSQENINFSYKIKQILISKSQTLAIIDQVTNGLIFNKLSLNEDRHLRGAFLCPNNASLHFMLNIPAKMLLTENPLKKSYLLAQKIRTTLKSNIGLSLTKIKTKTEIKLHVTIDTETEQSHKKFILKNDLTNMNDTIIEATLGTLYFFLSTRL